MKSQHTRIGKKFFGIIVILTMILSDVPAGFLIDVYREGNIVDTLYRAYRDGNVVDMFSPDKAYAAEATIDGTVNTTTARHQKSGKNIVCISDQTCYAFYNDSDADLDYQKSTDGGASWGGTGTDIHVGTWEGVAVWYDQWTPGDSGTLVHMVYFSTADDLTYAQFNTSGDSFTANVVIASTGAQGSLTSANDMTVTKGTDGDIYVGTVDAAAPTSPASFIHKCSASCTTAGNWSSAGSNPWDGAGDDTDGNHGIILLPLTNTAAHDDGDIMLVSYDIGDSSVEYKVYDDSANSWSTDFTNIQTSVTDNTTYRSAFGGTINSTTGALYITYVPSPGTANTSEVRAWKYSDSWSQLTDPWPDTTDGTSIVLDANIGLDTNTDDLYVVYIRAASTAASNDVYYAVSTNDGSSWSTDNLLSSGTDRDHRAVSINAHSNSRLYAMWNDTLLDDIFGNTVADLWVWEQAAYRFFNNANGTDVGSALAVQDTAATLGSAGDAFRLRMLLHNTGQAPLSGENLKLQFAQQSGTCDTGFVGETYADVTAATVIAYNNNATPVDGDNLTANANDPTHGADTIVNQDYEELNNFTNSVAAILSAQDGKWDFSLKDNGATASTAYCLRAVQSAGTVLDTYTVIPQITTAAGAPAESLTFSLGTNSLALGTLSATAVTSGSHTLTVGTNAANGVVVTYSGSTLTSGGNTITAMSTAAASSAGTEQFGINAKDNVTPNVVLECSGTPPIAAAATGYATVDNFKFVSGETVISSSGSINDTTCTISYIANISAATEAGTYTSTLTYIATGTF